MISTPGSRAISSSERNPPAGISGSSDPGRRGITYVRPTPNAEAFVVATEKYAWRPSWLHRRRPRPPVADARNRIGSFAPLVESSHIPRLSSVASHALNHSPSGDALPNVEPTLKGATLVLPVPSRLMR